MSLFIGANSVDSIVTDPPYGLGFMGKEWDHGVPGVEFWQHAFDVLKPGGHLLAFSGSRTYHRMVCAIEDAGFEIRDQIMWVYGSGFPKSLDVSKAIDKSAGAERAVLGIAGKSGSVRNSMAGDFAGGEYMTTAPATEAAQQWQGWGTALKPAHEPICVARKPLIGTVAANVLHWGTGALNIDACRVATDENLNGGAYSGGGKDLALATSYATGVDAGVFVQPAGRWPANLIHDGSDDVLAAFPESKSGGYPPEGGQRSQVATYGKPNERGPQAFTASEGSAARFFYCAKASRKDRNEGLTDPGPIHKHGTTLRQMENAVRDGVAKGNTHPTVKPTDLMAYLCRLVTPPGGVILDPFMGSGSTGKAAMREGFHFVGCELDADYVAIAEARIAAEIAKAAA